LYIVEFSNVFPVKIFKRFFSQANDYFNYKLLQKKGIINTETVLWQFDPFRFSSRPSGISIKKIYHVVDPYDHIYLDKDSASNSDLIICTSPLYMEHYQGLSNNVLYIPHGVSSDEFNTEAKKVAQIQKSYAPYFICIGSISNDLDFNVLRGISGIINSNILFLGPEKITNPQKAKDWEALKNEEYVKYLGTVNGKDLKNYIQGSIGGLAIYNFDLKKTIGQGSPLKILNYLAQYKPIICSIATEISGFEEKGIFEVSDKNQFTKALLKIENQEIQSDKDSITTYLTEHNYQTIIKTILENLKQY